MGYPGSEESARFLAQRTRGMGTCADRDMAHRIPVDARDRAIRANTRRADTLAYSTHNLLRRRRTQRIERGLDERLQLSARRKSLLRHCRQRTAGNRPEFLARPPLLSDGSELLQEHRDSISLGGAGELQLRVNCFNIFNQLNLSPLVFSGTGTHPDQPFLGEAPGALSGRVVELQARFSF
jgi:hypothetical protein